MGKDTLRKFNAHEAHGENWLSFEPEHGLVKFKTHVSERDGHSRINIGGNVQLQMWR